MHTHNTIRSWDDSDEENKQLIDQDHPLNSHGFFSLNSVISDHDFEMICVNQFREIPTDLLKVILSKLYIDSDEKDFLALKRFGQTSKNMNKIVNELLSSAVATEMLDKANVNIKGKAPENLRKHSCSIPTVVGIVAGISLFAALFFAFNSGFPELPKSDASSRAVFGFLFSIFIVGAVSVVPGVIFGLILGCILHCIAKDRCTSDKEKTKLLDRESVRLELYPKYKSKV